MSTISSYSNTELALRCHDVTVCMESAENFEFRQLSMLGMTVRVALHLRGLPLIPYDLFEKVLYGSLNIGVHAISDITMALAGAEFVIIHKEGNTIKSILPTVPQYGDIFDKLGEYFKSRTFGEPEVLTVELMYKLSGSPLAKNTVYNWGAERKVVDRVLEIGDYGSFLRTRRARGRDILISPTYFAENMDSYADLAAQEGAGNIKKVLDLLKANPGWPYELIKLRKEINGQALTDAQMIVIQALAGEGFLSPPMIETTHAGNNSFLFGPSPTNMQLPASKRLIYDAAIALVSSMRQGQLLPAQYAIHSPVALLKKLRNEKQIKASTEAAEQYRRLATMKVARLLPTKKGWAELHLIDRPENVEAVDLAIMMLSGQNLEVTRDEEVVIAFREGQKYLDSLLGQKRLRQVREPARLALDAESNNAIDNLILRGL